MNKADGVFSSTVSVLGTAIAYLVGVIDGPIVCLLFFMLFDMLTGTIKGVYMKELDSGVMFKGIIKKVMMFVMLMFCLQLDKLLGYDYVLRNMCALFFVANEGISILENVGTMIELPSFIKTILNKLKSENDAIDEK